MFSYYKRREIDCKCWDVGFWVSHGNSYKWFSSGKGKKIDEILNMKKGMSPALLAWCFAPVLPSPVVKITIRFLIHIQVSITSHMIIQVHIMVLSRIDKHMFWKALPFSEALILTHTWVGSAGKIKAHNFIIKTSNNYDCKTTMG